MARPLFPPRCAGAPAAASCSACSRGAVGLGVLARHRLLPEQGPMPFITAKPAAEKDCIGEVGPVAGCRRARPPHARKPEVRLLQDPARAGGAGEREGAARARPRRGERSTARGKERYSSRRARSRNPAEADNQKARLAISASSRASSRPICRQGNLVPGTMGPYTKVEEIHRVRRCWRRTNRRQPREDQGARR